MKVEYKVMDETVFVDEENNVYCKNKDVKELFTLLLNSVLLTSETNKGFASGFEDFSVVTFVAIHDETKSEQNRVY